MKQIHCIKEMMDRFFGVIENDFNQFSDPLLPRDGVLYFCRTTHKDMSQTDTWEIK